MPRILLLSAYHADSHDFWCRGLMESLPEVDWTLLTLPPRHFSWRIRGNGLTWCFSEAQHLREAYDRVVATSMVDLATLRGLVPELARVPALVYFHENQFAYPRSNRQHSSIEPQMVNLYTALCGETVLFNSGYNRESFLKGVDDLLTRLPDGVPQGIPQRLRAQSAVLPVPLHDSWFSNHCLQAGEGPLTLVWNHRWEYDKCPERFLHALQRVPAHIPLRVHVLGQQFRRHPPVMDELHSFLVQRGSLGNWGYVADGRRYRQLLQESHAVVSTAVHDFQGLAVLQAVAAGCLPLVPQRLVYPEWFGNLCYTGRDTAEEAQALAEAIVTMAGQHQAGKLPPPPSVDQFRWSICRRAYREAFGAF